MRSQSGRGQRCLLYQGIAREVAVLRGAQKPLRLRRLRPVKTQRADVVAKRDADVLGYNDGRNARNQAIRRQLRQRVELRRARRAVCNAGIFMDMLERSEDPELVFHEGRAESAHIVLAGEWLLGIGRRILNREARIELR